MYIHIICEHMCMYRSVFNVHMYTYIGPTLPFLLKTTWNIALYKGNKVISGITMILTNLRDLACSIWNCHCYTRILTTIKEEQDGASPWCAAPKCLSTPQTKAFCVCAQVGPEGAVCESQETSLTSAFLCSLCASALLQHQRPCIVAMREAWKYCKNQ